MPSTDKDSTKAELEEKLHFKKVVNAFRSYKKYSVAAIHRREDYINKLPADHQKLLRGQGYQDVLDDMKQAVEKNAGVVQDILNDVDLMFDNSNVAAATDKVDSDSRTRPDSLAMDKVNSTLKQIVRDWAAEGAREREQCYGPLLTALTSLHPAAARPGTKVLVPGAGLGRLAWEIAREGFDCEGNEFSLYMLFTSNFILNKCQSINCFSIHPYVHAMCNNVRREDQLVSVAFPDTDPNLLPEQARFSMAAGDFLEVYSGPEYVGSQDVVVTCFFLDCAHNILQFVQTIHRVLRPGGAWLNLGPLLYHFADSKTEDSIEPDYRTLRGCIQELGFEFVTERESVPCTYSQNPTSMLQYTYNCVMFHARKC